MAKLTALLPGMVCQFRLFQDGKCTFPYASAGIFDIFALRPEDVRQDGTPLFERIHPDDLARINAAVRTSATNLTPILEQFRIRLPDGTVTWAESRAQPELLDDGSVLWHSFVTNISHHKQLEEISSRRELLFRKMADASPVFIWVFNADGLMEYINKTMLEFLGASMPQVTGNGWRNFTHIEDLAPAYADLKAKMAAREPFQHIVRTLRHDGVYRVTANWARPWFNDDGSLGGYIGSGIDITEQKTAQDEVLKMRDQLDSILSSLPEVVYSVSPDFTSVHFIGHATQQVYGRPAHEFTQDPDLWLKLIHPNDVFHVDAFMDNLHRHGNACTEYRIIKPDGSLGWVSNKARVIRNSSGASVRVDGTVVDITDRVDAGAQLIKTRDAAERASQHKSEFLASMSHEIRTPMTAIVGYAHLLTTGHPTPSEQALWSGHIRRNSDYLLNLVNDILDLSKIEAGQVQLQTQPVDPWDAVQNVVSLMAPRAAEKLLQLSASRSGAVPRQISTDGTRLRQILVNIVSNAIKFTDHGHVAIEMTSQNNLDTGRTTLIFRIKDTGIGISPDNLEKLFKPFSRVAEFAPGTVRPGTGLGLSIAMKFCAMMHGGITVDSVPGHGSTFTVKIDAGITSTLTLVQAPQAITNSPLNTDQSLAPNALTGARILVTDDNPDNQRIVEFILQQAGATIELANHGGEAIDRIMSPNARPTIDLVFMDMQMPVCDGYTATRMLRSRGHTLPIIALTAYTMADDRQKCLDAGCTSYLTKPVIPDTLIHEALRWLPASGQPPAPPALSPPSPNPSTTPPPATGSSQRFAQLVQGYRTGLQETRKQILLQLENPDREPLRVLAHQLKGSGTSYGFPGITRSGAALDAAIKTGRSLHDIELLAASLLAEIDHATSGSHP